MRCNFNRTVKRRWELSQIYISFHQGGQTLWTVWLAQFRDGEPPAQQPSSHWRARDPPRSDPRRAVLSLPSFPPHPPQVTGADAAGSWSQQNFVKPPHACSVAQSCPTLCDPMDCSLPGSPVHGIFQGRILEWVAISYSKGSSQPRGWTLVSCIAGTYFYQLSYEGSHFFVCHINIVQLI